MFYTYRIVMTDKGSINFKRNKITGKISYNGIITCYISQKIINHEIKLFKDFFEPFSTGVDKLILG